MTIASCLVLPEGVVFGVDSTTSTSVESGLHYLNHNQKLFEVGDKSTLAVMTWGLSFFRSTSYRTLVARLSDKLAENPAASVTDATTRFRDIVWEAYHLAFADEIAELREIEQRQRAAATSVSDTRSEADDKRHTEISELKVGFCLGGHHELDRIPAAFWFEVEPTQISKSPIYKVDGELFKGQPSYFNRLYDGFDIKTRDAIVNAKREADDKQLWVGTKEELNKILEEESLFSPELTVRDGIDFVHFSIYATIKALKFSTRGQVCGGPIELAVITTDRKFRWVRHKLFDSAVGYDGV